jgi:hypothetical protein
LYLLCKKIIKHMKEAKDIKVMIVDDDTSRRSSEKE